MSRYRMDDGVIVDTDKSTHQYEESTRWNGNNHISIATGSQWEHETLYRSAKGRYYVEHTSQWQGSTPSARWVDHAEAASWLIENGEELPDELAALEQEICE